MCDMGSISAASTLPLGGTSTTDVAGASGGGAVAATGASLSPDVLAQLQASIDAISALTSALGGSSALGSAPVSAGGPGVVQQTPVQAGGGTTAMPGMPGMPGMPATKGMKMPKGSSHHMVMERTTPVDKARAQKIANAVKQFFGHVKRSQVKFAPGKNTHGVLPESMRKAFKAKYPDLPAPRSIVFPKDGTNTPIGVVYNEKANGNFDLGMGVKHKHSANGSAMEHVWFTPNDLNLAYADSMGGTTKTVEAALGL